MKKKKVLMVCEAFGGGVFTYVSQLCNDMIETFDVYLAYSIRTQTPTNYKEFLDSRINLIEIKEFGSLRHIRKSIKKLRQIEKDIKPDIIHLHSSLAGGIGRIAFKGKNNKLIYTPHGYAHILMGAGLKSKLFKFAEKRLGKKKCITLTCTQSEDEIAKKICKETYYIETGVNLENLNSSLLKTEAKKFKNFSVFTLGRVCTQKQPELFNEIALLCPEVDFYWIGSGELQNKLTAPNITITGWMPRLEALEMAKGADVFILCSLGEAVAMSLIENMYLKKLCLVSNTMGNKSVIQHGINGYICEKPEDYANCIKEAMEFFPTDLTEKAYSDVLEVYNTETMKKKYINFYNSLLENN